MPGNRRRQPVRYLVFSASLRRDSLNTRLAELAASAVEAGGGDVDVAAMRDFDAPSYDQDVQREEGFPPGAEEFRRRLEACQGFVVAAPEYNASMPGALKNAIDWVSRYQPQPFNERHGLLMSASPSMGGGNRGLWALRVPFEHLGSRLYPDMFSLARAHLAFTAEGRIADEQLQQRFDANISNFMDLVEASTHYPCVKRAWVEYLGEHPEPSLDRVELWRPYPAPGGRQPARRGGRPEHLPGSLVALLCTCRRWAGSDRVAMCEPGEQRVTGQSLRRRHDGKRALVVRGGWEGHVPVPASNRYAQVLRESGFDVTVSDSLDSYLDEPQLAATDLVVQCWTTGTISSQQADGLSRAIRSGTGFAGWHGGIVDAFRAEPAYSLVTGGQFVYHPRGFVSYEVRPVADRTDHPVLAGVEAFTITTEQYYLHVDPGNDVLAVTDFVADPASPDLAGIVMPVTWTRRWGTGRVFVTTIGHSIADLEVPQVDAMIRAGMAWAAR